jgi:type 1 glutamine amidotransferase
MKPKAPGETRVVAIFGITDWNNGIGHEIHVRDIFKSKKDWRLVFVRANKFFTPELIGDADLLITCRAGGADPIDLFSADAGVADSVVPGAPLWTEKNVKAVIENVRSRGMGLLALHNTIGAGNRPFLDFLDVKEIMPNEFEPLWARKVNKDHPVTQGVGKFFIPHDEQYAVIIKSTSTATLIETTAIHEKRQAVSGWALESGKGRIVGLLPGSTVHAYMVPEYRNILWRAAHWAMRRDIPPYPEAKNTLYD